MNNVYPLQTYYQYEDFPLCVVNMPAGSQTADLPHSHDCSELAIITAGEGEYLFGESSHHITAGDVLLLHPGYYHSYRMTKNLGVLNILYDSRKLPFPLQNGGGLPNFHMLFPLDKESMRCTAAPLIHLKPDELASLMEKAFSLSEELNGGLPGTVLSSIAIFLEILVQLLRCFSVHGRKKNQEPNQVARAVAFIKKNFSSPVTMKQLAKIAFMSPRHFYRTFHQVTGYTPLDYLHRRRLQHAVILLKTTQSHVDEIAYASGFNSSTYFCRMFKEQFHCTPQQFRMQNRDVELLMFKDESF